MDILKIVNQKLKPGKYVIAVSGGVDSVVLLDIVAKTKGLELIVAHFDHGIRDDSKSDQKLVRDLAKKYGLIFETKSVNLGPRPSEQSAREARYEFLKSVMGSYRADGIITAHHQDDVIETAIFNLLRGTGRKGITSLGSNDLIIRPLLGINKAQIKDYALSHKLVWREDSTNQDLRYKRNLIRSKLAQSPDKLATERLLNQISSLRSTNKQLDQELDELAIKLTKNNKLVRNEFINLPHKLAVEVMAHYLRQNNISSYDTKLLNNLVIAAKTYKQGSLFSINKTAYLMIERQFLAIKTDQR
jgi:tRNA(Ile)-lysidine synthase